MPVRGKWLPVLVAIAAFCSLFGYACWRALGPPPIPRAIVDEGDRIVRALQKYKVDVGLWPERLDDLVPTYQEAVPSGWEYHWWPHGTPWRLIHQTKSEGIIWADSHMTHWAVGVGRGKRRADDRPLPEFRQPTTRTSSVLENSLTELARRSGRDPTNSWHWRGRISLLIQADRRSEAIRVCLESAQAVPHDWWPRAVRAKLLLEAGRGPEGIREYSDWCDDHPRFAHYWYLSLLYRQHGDREAALAALVKMSEHPLGYHGGDALVPGFIGYDAAAYAYVNKRPELVVALCNRWPAQLVDGWGGCVDAMRALALLSLKDFDGATRYAKQVADRGGHPDWVNDFGAIQRAIEQSECDYEHKALKPPLNELRDYLVDYE